MITCYDYKQCCTFGKKDAVFLQEQIYMVTNNLLILD